MRLFQQSVIGIFLLLLSWYCFAQRAKKQTVINGMADFFFEKGKSLIENHQQEKKAILAFRECLKNDSNYLRAYKYLAFVYNNRKEYENALFCFKKIQQLDSSMKPYLPYYATTLAGLGYFKEARKALYQFLIDSSISNIDKQSFRKNFRNMIFAADYIRYDSSVHMRPLQGGVNTADMEYEPCFTVNEDELFFTRNDRKQENIFCAKRDSEQTYKTPQKVVMIDPLSNEGSSFISMDGKILLITYCQPNASNNCDIYMSKLTPLGWGKPMSLGPEINSNYWDSQPSLSPDNQKLYFVSNRPGGYGGKDIYVATLQKNGSYGKVKNLGKTINTYADEQMPYMHSDNQTFYFTSNGWQGYGGDDLFVSKKINDSTYTTPTNLGYPINTINDETRIYVSRDGHTAYYAACHNDSKGMLDIYTFELPHTMAANPVVAIKGKITDMDSNTDIVALVKAVDIQHPIFVQIYSSDKQGNYLLNLPAGEEYNILINQQGHLPYTINLDLSHIKKDTIIDNMNIYLDPIQVGKSLMLKNVYFKTDSFNIELLYFDELNTVVEFLKSNPNIQILIVGHTDNQGTQEYNMKLSLKRAESIAQYFIQHGINGTRIKTEGKGYLLSINNNENENERALNRRIEIKIIKK